MVEPPDPLQSGLLAVLEWVAPPEGYRERRRFLSRFGGRVLFKTPTGHGLTATVMGGVQVVNVAWLQPPTSWLSGKVHREGGSVFLG